MTTFQQLLLIKVAEECNEVAQRALKAVQFGLDQKQRGKPPNRERLRREISDLQTVIHMLDRGLMGWRTDEKQEKERRVRKYLGLSRRLKQVR